MAHKKGQGSTQNGRDSNPQFRGIKLYGGEHAKSEPFPSKGVVPLARTLKFVLSLLFLQN